MSERDREREPRLHRKPYYPFAAAHLPAAMQTALYLNTKLEPADSFLGGSHVHDQAIARLLAP